jgi:DNA-binding NarL/FixJ family response regulator
MLTKREVEVLKAIAQGQNSEQIAETLHVSERTVRNHLANIYKKLGVHDRTQAVLYAVRHGLVDPRRVDDS